MRAKQQQVASQYEAVCRELNEMKQRLSQLEQQKALLDDLLDVPAASMSGLQMDSVRTAVVSNATPLSTVQKCRPSDGVMQILHSRPNGITQKEIVRELVNKIETESDNPQAIIRNTILNLIKRKRIQRDDRTNIITLLGGDA